MITRALIFKSKCSRKEENGSMRQKLIHISFQMTAKASMKNKMLRHHLAQKKRKPKLLKKKVAKMLRRKEKATKRMARKVKKVRKVEEMVKQKSTRLVLQRPSTNLTRSMRTSPINGAIEMKRTTTSRSTILRRPKMKSCQCSRKNTNKLLTK